MSKDCNTCATLKSCKGLSKLVQNPSCYITPSSHKAPILEIMAFSGKTQQIHDVLNAFNLRFIERADGSWDLRPIN